MTDETLADELIPSFSNSEDEGDDRYCACGCGEKLSPLAKWKYIRGHKLAATAKTYQGETSSNLSSLAFATPKVTKKQRDDMQAKTLLMLTMLSFPLSRFDPVCVGAFQDNAETIAAKLVPIFEKSPQLVEWFVNSSGFMLWLDLLAALQPVAMTIAQHHITHTIESDTENRLPNEAYAV